MRNHPVDQSVAFGSGGVDGVTEQEQLEGTTQAYNSWQQISGPHVGPGQTNPGEKEGQARLLGDNTQIGGQGKNSSCPRRHTIESGDDGLIQQAHVLYDGSGHTRELQVTLHVTLEQFTDNLVNIAAGAEVVPCSG